MTDDRWPDVGRLCAAALERDPEARPAFLAAACAGDPELRREVDSLLACQATANAVFAVSAIEAAAEAIAAPADALPAGAWLDGVPSPAGQRLAKGTRLGPYEIVALLGTGGMGEVYRALDTRLVREVAIKVLPPEVAADPERVRRFQLEAQAVAALNHPSIVAIFDVGESAAVPVGATGGNPASGGSSVHYLVTELLEGETLRERIARGPLPLTGALDIARPIVRALAAAHDRHIVHRDLKPSNVFLTTGGQVKLLDFGIAKVVRPGAPDEVGEVTPRDPSAGTSSRLGTVGYMSPEQVMGLPTDARSDIFSFGAVLYEMLAGRPAFGGAATADTPSAILADAPPPLAEYCDDAPAALQSVVLRCLAKRPENRFQSADDLARDLAKLSAPPRRARRLVWAAVALLLAAAGVAGALYVQRDGHGPAAPVALATMPGHARTAVAVLPLENLSSDTAQAYFARGLHDELITLLAKVAALRVIARTSVMGYRATTKPLAQIADELGVGTIVEGSVQVTGGQLRVSVNIVDSETGQLLRTVQDDGTIGDALAIQSRIAQKVVAAVGAALSKDEQGRIAQAPTSNAEAYRLYLQGRDYWNRSGYLEANVKASEQLYERAVELDPAFALAHAALSEAHGESYWFRWDASPARAAHQRQHAEDALRLAPDLPQAHVAMALVHCRLERDFRRGLAEFNAALKGQPNDATIVGWVGYLNRRSGNWDEAFASYEKAILLNPRDADLFWDLGGETFTLTRHYAEAVAAYDRALILAPDLHGAAIRRGLAWILWRGDLRPLREVLNGLPEGTELGPRGSVAGERAALLLFAHDAAGLLQMPEVRRARDLGGQVYFVPGALLGAWAHRLRGDDTAARASFRAAVVRLDAAVRELPDDWRIHAARGLALAGLRRRDDALAEANWLERSEMYRKDVHLGSMVAEARAQILAQSGSAEAALDEIERLLSGPSWLSVHTLRLDPRWDPIRDHPRFRALLEKYGS